MQPPQSVEEIKAGLETTEKGGVRQSIRNCLTVFQRDPLLSGAMVCSKQLYKEALNHAFDEPKQWEIREINEIMNQCISSWRYFPNPRMFSEYGRQKGWERENPATDSGNPSEKTMDGFVEVTEQMELPF